MEGVVRTGGAGELPPSPSESPFVVGSVFKISATAFDTPEEISTIHFAIKPHRQATRARSPATSSGPGFAPTLGASMDVEV
jgi:hypothetical protein